MPIMSFPNGGSVTFNASSEAPVEIRFAFEYQPYPNVDPTFSTEIVTINGATSAYTATIDPRPESETYSNFLLYGDTPDQVAESITDVTINGAEELAPQDPDYIVAIPNADFSDGIQNWLPLIFDDTVSSVSHDEGEGSNGEPGFAVIASDEFDYYGDTILISHLEMQQNIAALGLEAGEEYTVELDMKLISGSDLGFSGYRLFVDDTAVAAADILLLSSI